MHFSSVVSVCLLCSSLAAAGPLPWDRSRKLEFRQAAPFKNTTSTTDSAAATIEVVPVSFTETPLDTTTATTSSSTEISTASTATTLSTSGFTNTTFSTLSSIVATTTAGDVPITTALPTATAAADGANAGDGANGAQTATGTSQTAKQTISSNASGYVTIGSIVGGTGNFSRTTLASATSNTDASTDSKPTTTGSDVFPFVESPTTTPSATSTTAEAPFTFSSDPATPTTVSTDTTGEIVAITVSGVGVAVPVTPSFFSSVTPLPTTTDVPITTSDKSITDASTTITATASASSNVAAGNLRLAKEYNNNFATLTSESSCTSNTKACIGGNLATCLQGRYILTECSAADTACFALPLTDTEGVYVSS
ncbi:hypothetical protein V491_06554 [Pseudogymnoascus sp. VKM F-3775]|nr:hypothetical protein V491_06554 [Pseudogymnoascus sp. VKM F-3775]